MKEPVFIIKKPVFSRKRATFILLSFNILLFLISLFYAYLVFLAGDGEVVECAFKNIFHLYCPGCGGSRSVLFLFKLDFLLAFLSYPPIYVLLFFLIYLDSRAVISIVRNDNRYFASFNLNILLIIPAIILFHFFLRNIALVFFRYDFLGDIITKL